MPTRRAIVVSAIVSVPISQEDTTVRIEHWIFVAMIVELMLIALAGFSARPRDPSGDPPS